VRDNLDPESNVQSDDLLIDVLRKASIWSVIEPRGGLDAKGADLGLSAGQQQLFCIARAMLSRHKVVLLDEATSSVDRATDEEIRRLVREEMEGKTVVEVAHRLEILKDFDLVVVMGEGKILEVGNPAILLSRESEFKSLWKSQGL
jgi:ABC-type multidrug transport system fused ATPase/permease subunit